MNPSRSFTLCFIHINTFLGSLFFSIIRSIHNILFYLVWFFYSKIYHISKSKIFPPLFIAWIQSFTTTNNAAINISACVLFCTCALSSILPSLWPACVWAPVYGGCCGWTPGGWAAEEEEAMLSGVPERSSAGALGGPGWSLKSQFNF